jgi:hypothetical protein
MTGREFLTVAIQLAGASTRAEWRSAISRAYYAAFHVARESLEELRSAFGALRRVWRPRN